MAKIVGPVPPFIGTRDNVTIYRMNGEYIARTKSSLTGKRVKKDPAFARTMEWAGRLKQGARIASGIYQQMPVDGRVYKQYREITGKAMSLLKEGFSVEDVITMLEAIYVPHASVSGDFRECDMDVQLLSGGIRSERAGGNRWPKLFEVADTTYQGFNKNPTAEPPS
ncbi:hypothetical protein [Chitinophaga ginsengisoli]|uniref:Uncharacterized protein n=1 Tax=Chitinophaga ginsengisoli TaxID=363837 RepID=A0A2P8G6Y5_9BACT|nr:hypothetical protein [Chitinophaga ginsengisoli]PSL29739.1 hypothetical protein CLV42_10673 [Chitinophaga ginsengisoli]